MVQPVVFRTGSSNAYLYSPHLNQVILLHPIEAFLLELRDQGIDPHQWYDRLEGDGFTRDDGEHFPRQDLDYYLKKYDFWSEMGYFQPKDTEKVLGGRLKSQDIEFQLANCEKLTFEVTEACNLDCHYCGYGKFYNRTGVRTRKKMEWPVAKRFLDYMAGYWNSGLNLSHRKNINVSFYGGEPLMNMALIRQVVEYAGALPLRHNHFTFSMTTNGTLLHEHLDFLVQHGFIVHISLDGNESHNGYRVFSDGEPTFRRIEENIELLKTSYPAYFRDNVHFITVLHNKNAVAEVLRYFKDKYDKRALIVELNTNGIAPEHAEEFCQTYKNYKESLQTSNHYCEIRRDFFRDTPEVYEANAFLTAYNGNVFRHIYQLLHLDHHQQYFPTATCLPFGNKIYVTANGGIMPCERIDPGYTLGTVDNQTVSLDFEDIARRYNRYYDKLGDLCRRCYKSRDCGHCLFYLPGIDDRVKCPGCTDPGRFSRFMGLQMSLIEEKPEVFSNFIEEVNIT